MEGEDDKHIWDQVVRSSDCRFSVWPCPAGSIEKIGTWETWLAEKLPSLYDDPKAFSLRDRDDRDSQSNDLDFIVRCRLECRAAENLILAGDTLRLAGTTWETVIEGCEKWLQSYPDHPKQRDMKEFADTGFDRFSARLKEIRNILVAIIGVSRPWEVLVGQAIAQLVQGNRTEGEASLRRYLGEKLCSKLLKV